MFYHLNVKFMKKIIIIASIAALVSACSAPVAMQVKVAPLGDPVSESTELGVYVLPQTVLKVALVIQETKSVPGPFREYAEKYLGIKDVIKQNSSKWQILDMELKLCAPQRVGSLWLELDLVEEGLTWFMDRDSTCTRVRVEVRADEQAIANLI